MDLQKFVPKNDIGSVMLDDAELLRGLIKALNPLQIVEIGTFVGISTLVMAEAMQKPATIHTVDKHDHKMMDRAKELNLEKWIEFYHQDSFQFVQEIVKRLAFIDFVFYDGEAHVDQYLRHFDVLKTKMRPGSIYAVHDYYTRAEHHQAFLKQIQEKYVTIPTKKGITLIQI